MRFKKRKIKQIYTTIDDSENPKSKATRIRTLLKKNKGILKDKQSLVDFKEPIVMLMRRSRRVEFYEKATSGDFIFKHSDGKPRTIILEPSQQVSFDFAKKTFKGYWCHEDHPLPLPENPVLTAETMNLVVEKSTMDSRKLSAKSELLKNKRVIYWALAIAIVIGMIMIWRFQLIQGLIDALFGTDLRTIGNVVPPPSTPPPVTPTNNSISIGNVLGVQSAS